MRSAGATSFFLEQLLPKIPIPTNLLGTPVHQNIVATDVPLYFVEKLVPFSL